MTTLSDGLRQSDRVRFRMPVEASWLTAAGVTLTQNAETLLVSRNGGVLRLTEKLSMGQELHLRRNLEGDNWKRTRARVVAEIDQDPPNHFLYAVHILDPRSDFWDIDSPAPHKAEEALARLLMESSFCQRREVAYLNELELKSFEIRKCVARLCRHCEAPSIWIESQSEVRVPENGAARPTVEQRVIPPRSRTRIKAASWLASAAAAFRKKSPFAKICPRAASASAAAISIPKAPASKSPCPSLPAPAPSSSPFASSSPKLSPPPASTATAPPTSSLPSTLETFRSVAEKLLDLSEFGFR